LGEVKAFDTQDTDASQLLAAFEPDEYDYYMDCMDDPEGCEMYPFGETPLADAIYGPAEK
jgi:hypothetical protein